MSLIIFDAWCHLILFLFMLNIVTMLMSQNFKYRSFCCIGKPVWPLFMNFRFWKGACLLKVNQFINLKSSFCKTLLTKWLKHIFKYVVYMFPLLYFKWSNKTNSFMVTKCEIFYKCFDNFCSVIICIYYGLLLFYNNLLFFYDRVENFIFMHSFIPLGVIKIV